jgi:hypothetical protein
MLEGRKLDVMTFRKREKFLAQIFLILESGVILSLCIFAGIILPGDFSNRVRKIISQSILFDDIERLRYALIAAIIFLSVHQHLCWRWLVSTSKKYFADTNLGKIIFLYGCSGLIFFSLGLILYQFI